MAYCVKDFQGEPYLHMMTYVVAIRDGKQVTVESWVPLKPAK